MTENDATDPRANLQGGRRLAVEASAHLDDWWVGYSPRNGSNALVEGTWAEWVKLARLILDADVSHRRAEAHTPTDDEREALLTEADALIASWDLKGSWSPDSPVGLVMRLADALRRSEVPEASAEDQGPAASCHLCVGAGGYEDYDGEWIECSCQREPQGEPSDAQVEAAAREAFFTDDAGGHIRGGHTWETIPEVGRENYRTMVRAVLHAARAAGGVR